MKVIPAGFSHGKKLVGILQNVPSNLVIDESVLEKNLKLRRDVYGRSTRQQLECDKFEIISGVIDGKTNGGNISFEIENNGGITSSNKNEIRGGHADYAGLVKYGLDDVNKVIESASARITAVYSLAGGIAECFLNSLNIKVLGYTKAIGSVKLEKEYTFDELKDIYDKPLYMPDNSDNAIKLIDDAKNKGDTLGGVIEVRVKGLKCGFGSYNYGERLNAKLCASLMNIPSIKAVEVGDGILMSQSLGSVVFDGFSKCGRTNNFNGGIEGGISNGEEIVIKCYVKPIPTNRLNPTFDKNTFESKEPSKLRGDVTVVPSVSVLASQMVMLTLTEVIAESLGNDDMNKIIKRYNEL